MSDYLDDHTASGSEPFPEMRMLAYGLVAAAIVSTVLLAVLIVHLPTLWGMVSDWIIDAGGLKGCIERGLRGGECVAFAQERV